MSVCPETWSEQRFDGPLVHSCGRHSGHDGRHSCSQCWTYPPEPEESDGVWCSYYVSPDERGRPVVTAMFNNEQEANAFANENDDNIAFFALGKDLKDQ